MPANASQGVKSYYDQKLAQHKKILDLIKKADEDRFSNLDKITALEKQVEEIGSKNKKLVENVEGAEKIKGTIGTLKKDLEGKDSEIKKLKDELAREKSAHEATKTKNSAFKI